MENIYTPDELVDQAQSDYGEMVTEIAVWPPGLGIDVHLIGGEVIQYFPDGTRYEIEQPSIKTNVRRIFARLRGVIRRAP